MRKLLIISFLCASVLAGGCGGQKIPLVHRIDIPQGNVVTQDMLDRLEPGLNKRQVTYIMGSPMLVDVFNQEEWIYLYSFQPGGGDRVQRRVSLFFDDDRLVRVDGDVRLAEEMPVAVRSAAGSSRSVDVPEGVGAGYEDGGILQGVIDRFAALNPLGGDEKKRKPETPATAAPSGEEEAAGDGDAAAQSDGTMQRYSLESGDVGTAPPADTAPEEEPEDAPVAGAAGPGAAAGEAHTPAGEEPPGFLERLKRGLGMGSDDAGSGGGSASPP